MPSGADRSSTDLSAPTSALIGTAAGSTVAEVRSGIPIAVMSAMAFGLSGPMAAALLAAGWSAGAAVTARVVIAALVLVVPGVRALRRSSDARFDWSLLRGNVGTIVVYGTLAVAGAQLCYFYAVSRLPVGVALLVEYTAPIAVVAWMWLVHRQRPRGLTVVGAGIALCGLPLLLDVSTWWGGSGGPDKGVDLLGVAWALAAMVGAAAYFVMSADDSTGLPPITLAASGLVVGAVVLGAAGLAGVLPIDVSDSDVSFRAATVPWWVPIAVLGVVTAAFAYVTGIVATRKLGSRLASFVALSEVVAAIVFAWLLLGQVPMEVQLVGAAVVLVGVVVVRAGEMGRRAT